MKTSTLESIHTTPTTTIINTVHNHHHHQHFGHYRPKAWFGFRIGIVTNKKPTHIMEITLTNEQQVLVTLAPKTEAGAPVTLDGQPAWSVVSGTCTLIVAEGGLSATVRSGDAPGDSVLLVEADADLGAGVVTLSDTLRVSVVGALAKSLGLTVGTPTLKTP